MSARLAVSPAIFPVPDEGLPSGPVPPLVESYRAYRFPWVATPLTLPLVYGVRSAGATTTTVAASWDGATGIASWQVLAGPSPTSLSAVGAPVPWAGLETQVAVPTVAAYVGVEALSATGQVLAQAAPVAVAAA